MRRVFARLAGLFLFTLVSGLVALGVLVVGMRKQSPQVLDRVRQFNRKVSNPRMLHKAGTEGNPMAVIEHVGRSSGNQYRTPVQAFPVDGGFLISLPYGRRSDWLANVVAAGTARLTVNGAPHEVTRPEVVPMADVVSLLPPTEQRTVKMFGVRECLRLHTD